MKTMIKCFLVIFMMSALTASYAVSTTKQGMIADIESIEADIAEDSAVTPLPPLSTIPTSSLTTASQ